VAAGQVRCTYRWIVEGKQVLGGMALWNGRGVGLASRGEDERGALGDAQRGGQAT